MINILYLGIAIISEVFASSMLKKTNGFKNIVPTITVIISYAVSFYFLSLSLLTIPLGTAYAAWAGLGTVLTAIIGILLYKESINLKKITGIVAIIIGVVVLNLV